MVDGAKDAGQAKLTLPDGSSHNIPLLEDQAGQKFIDVSRLLPTAGLCTYDPGFTSTGSCSSSITFIDGAKGVLLYRGYDVEELVSSGRDFYDVSWLLLKGELPTAASKLEWRNDLNKHTLLHQTLYNFFNGYKHDAHPMSIMVGTVGALSAFFPHPPGAALDDAAKEKFCLRMIAKMPTLAAAAYKTSIGQPHVYPRNDLTYAENLLHMLFAVPTGEYKPDPVHARALQAIIILHMDHEQNASTSTVRTAGSSQANPFACIASGVAALWGPAHGGANEAVLRMLEDIGRVENIPSCLARAKDRADPFRLMGFGHRVYKTYDPRAKCMKGICEEVLRHNGSDDPLLAVAVELERQATRDEYFVTRGLYPNVDFYSGIVLRAMGIPVTMYTVLFAVSRSVGWVAQWKEMASEPVTKISRPRQLYTGSMRRSVPPLAASGAGPESSMPAGAEGKASKRARR